MKDLSQLAKGLATQISQSNDNKIEAAQTATIAKVKNEVVADAVKENLSVSSMDDLTTDAELTAALQSYIKTSDLLKSGCIYNKKDLANGSYSLVFNESDGGGVQFYNKTSDMISYVGANDGGPNDVAIQIYSKYRDGVSETKNSGVRINVNPNGAYYTKGTNTSTDGGVANNGREIAVKADIPDLTNYATKSYVSGTAMTTAVDVVDAALNGNFAKIWQNFDADDNTKGHFYTKKNNTDGSYALVFNESDGGGVQYYNKNADMLSYVGVNDGNASGVAVQIYSKYKDGTGGTKNSGVRINVNPTAAYYTKGDNTSANGGVANEGREIAVKEDIEGLRALISALTDRVAALENGN